MSASRAASLSRRGALPPTKIGGRGRWTGARMDGVIRHLVVGSREGHRLAVEQALHDHQGLGQARDPDLAGIEAQACLVVLAFHVARAEPQLEPPVAQHVDRRRLARHQHRMAEVVVEHHGADAQPWRRLGGSSKSRHGRQHLGEMVGHAQRRVTLVFEPTCLVGPLRPGPGSPENGTEPERLHTPVRRSLEAAATSPKRLVWSTPWRLSRPTCSRSPVPEQEPAVDSLPRTPSRPARTARGTNLRTMGTRRGTATRRSTWLPACCRARPGRCGPASGRASPAWRLGSAARPRRAYAVRFSEALTASGLVSAR
jgi:hypothetical protein